MKKKSYFLIWLLRKNGITIEIGNYPKNLNFSNMLTYNNEIAELFGHHYHDIVKYDNETDLIYVFYKKWRIDKTKVFLMNIIREDFIPKLNEDMAKLSKYIATSNDDERSTDTFNRAKIEFKNYQIVLNKLQSGPKNEWYKMFISPCLSIGFGKLMDADTNLIGFENGVFDLLKKEFRKFNPEDLVSLSTGYDYDENNLEYEEELNNYFKLTFPDKEIRNFIKRYLASSLEGKNKYHLIVFFTGLSSKQTGSNGKSTLSTIMNSALGNYAKQGKSTVITSKIESSHSANPEMYSWMNKRYIMIEEPEHENEMSINMAKLKDLSGGVAITTRNVFQSSVEFKPGFNIVINANKVPKLSTIDGGTKRRIRNIPCESKFVANVEEFKLDNPGIEHVYQLDVHLFDRLEKSGPTMINMLIRWYYNYYLVYGLDETTTPEKILIQSENFINKQNEEFDEFFCHFIEPQIVFTDNPDNVITFIEFKTLVSNNGNSIKRDDLYDYIEHKYKNYFKNRNQTNGLHLKKHIHSHIIDFSKSRR